MTTESTLDEATLRDWIGKPDIRSGIVDVGPARRMEALLDREPGLAPGDLLPPLWTWLYLTDNNRASRLERDGRTVLGAFLPPVALPRRMWAGGRFRFSGGLIIGGTVERRSEISDVQVKQGRTGTLCFITARHDYRVDGGSRIIEEQDIVYRGEPSPDAPNPPPPPKSPEGAEISREVTPSAVMLFRYSALTFNGHRIHYDRDYSRDVEGYPDLVFHGPLTATLLADLAVEVAGGRPIEAFDYRAISPLFDDRPFSIHAKARDDGLALWAENPDGGLAMSATARF